MQALFVDKLKALFLGMVIGVPFLLVVLWLMDAMGFIGGFGRLLYSSFPALDDRHIPYVHRALVQ